MNEPHPASAATDRAISNRVMSSADLDRLEALSAAATPGPWTARNMGTVGFDSANQTGWWWVWQADVPHYAGVLLVDQEPDPEMGTGNIGGARITDHDDGGRERPDAEFIAAAREAVPALIATVRAQHDQLRSRDSSPAAPRADISCTDTTRTDDDLMELAARLADLSQTLGVAQVIERETKYLVERYRVEIEREGDETYSRRLPGRPRPSRKPETLC